MVEKSLVSESVKNARAAAAKKKSDQEARDAKNARRRELREEQAADAEKKKLVEAWDTDVNYERDMEWAYNNAMNNFMGAENAPSGPAWMICVFAREDSKGFMAMFAKMVEKRDKKLLDDAAMKESRAKQFEYIDVLKDEYSTMSFDAVADLLDSDPDFIGKILESRGQRMVPA